MTVNKKEKAIAKIFDRACLENNIFKQDIRTFGIPLTNGGLGFNDESGATDRICCYKGLFIAIELKRPKGGKYSKEQILYKKRIENAGGIWFGIKNEDDVQNFIIKVKSLT